MLFDFILLRNMCPIISFARKAKSAPLSVWDVCSHVVVPFRVRWLSCSGLSLNCPVFSKLPIFATCPAFLIQQRISYKPLGKMLVTLTCPRLATNFAFLIPECLPMAFAFNLPSLIFAISPFARLLGCLPISFLIGRPQHPPQTDSLLWWLAPPVLHSCPIVPSLPSYLLHSLW